MAIFIIPVGTRIEIRKPGSKEEPKRHITRKELHFTALSGSGYQGHILYFSYDEWEIAVNANLVTKPVSY
jgi:hypothetical protein